MDKRYTVKKYLLVETQKLREYQVPFYNVAIPVDVVQSLGLALGLCFPNGLRADILDEEMILKLEQAELYRLGYALETASPRLQKMIGKNVDLEKLEYMINFSSSRGIITHIPIVRRS